MAKDVHSDDRIISHRSEKKNIQESNGSGGIRRVRENLRLGGISTGYQVQHPAPDRTT